MTRILNSCLIEKSANMTKKMIFPLFVAFIVSLLFTISVFDAFQRNLGFLNLGLILGMCLFLGMVSVLFEVAGRSMKIFSLFIMSIFVISIVINLFSAGHILPSIFIQPSAQSIAESYVDAVMSDNLPQALTLTDGSEVCKQNMTEAFERLEAYLLEEHGESWREETIQHISLDDGYFLKQSIPHEVVGIIGYASEGLSEPHLLTSLTMSYPQTGKRYTCGYEALIN